MARVILSICLLLFSVSGYAEHVELMGARLSHSNNVSRAVFEFNKAITYHVFTLKHPDRIVVDFPDTSLTTNLKNVSFKNTSIHDLRHAERKDQTLRIVFDMKHHVKIKILELKPYERYGYRLVFDLTSPHQLKSKVHSIKTVVARKKKVVKARDIIVVIDPGHGGKDPGATGPMGIHEKNVVLAISKDIQHDLNKIPGIDAKLTRTGDYYLTLRDRLRIARKDNADFFIAIHADAFHDRTAKGASVFALSERGATSEAARWLAEKENYSELGGVYLANKSRLLRSVLIDLSQTATISESLQIGGVVLKDLKKVTPLHSDRVEQARFVVLKSPDIPSLLVETGFITNPYEERLLRLSSYQHKLAKALAAGINDYFWAHPPPNTLFVLEKHATHYVVKRGDNLSMIAEDHHTSVAAIKKLNRLKTDALRVGEPLQIPT